MANDAALRLLPLTATPSSTCAESIVTAPLLLNGPATACELSADCSLTASDQQVSRAQHVSLSLEDIMRITIASVLALCGTILFNSPAVAETITPQAAPPVQTAAKPTINLNTATADQLETLPGIGQKTAERIIEYRTKSGGFKRIEDLMNVKGIGEKSFLKLKPLVSVPPKTDKAPGD
jgi:competence protein ComEA